MLLVFITRFHISKNCTDVFFNSFFFNVPSKVKLYKPINVLIISFLIDS